MGNLWGGRFNKKTHQLVEEFTNSLRFDHRLAKYDCLGSLVHTDILRKAKILSPQEHRKLQAGLSRILTKIEQGIFKPPAHFEDIHSYIQHLLEADKDVGKVALKLHTCRSRNDQVAFDTKFYCLDHILKIERLLLTLIKNLQDLADHNAHIYLPGYTHLQHAIPIALPDQLKAYCEMLQRDELRMLQIFDNIHLVMGAGAIAGTMIPHNHYHHKLPIDLPKMVEPPSCPIDTVSDRDFILEFLFALSMLGQHLSRMAEDMILWASQEFNFISIDDAFCTGSSLMPHKKNPDVLELIRGHAGRLFGNLTSVFILMKGLPLSYNRDMQLDKEPLFASCDAVESMLTTAAALIKNISFNEKAIRAHLADEYLFATDIADHLVINGVAFKDAHHLVGELIRYANARQRTFRSLSAIELKRFHPTLTPSIITALLDPKASVDAKKSICRPKHT